ncbi:Long-chain-fatty-acid--CoA ligase FadD15 [[Eubacterium] contortum]|uniref:Long-chain-fatty-acid--CoA ligase FadD15 n=3 Tax=Clostridia TaxID=186801 RepID=A0A174APB7_9FIRM|nr:Long-chain-fatty-acid--CoA ligase FadD15 [[Eubacterium] contortum] [Faecalicatena contorta]
MKIKEETKIMEQKNIYKQVKLYKTLQECLLDVQDAYAERPAITSFDRAGTQRDVSYREFVKDVQGAAYMMVQKKMAGKHIALVGENTYEWIAAFCAAGCIGSVGVPIDVEQPEKEILNLAEFADASYAVVQKDFKDAFQGWKKERVICMDTGIREMIEEGRRKVEQEQIQGFSFAQDIGPDTTLAIVYTSGTTSVSKAVVLSHYNMMYDACCCQASVQLEDRMFNPLPLYHTYSLGCGILDMIAHGQNICINGNLKTLFRDIRLYRPSILMAVPLILENLLKEIHRIQENMGIREQTAQAVEKYKKGIFTKKPVKVNGMDLILGDQLKTICCGGAHLNEKIAEEFAAYGIDVLQGYGITECSPLISNSIRGQNRINSVGLPLPGVELKLADGEILVKGPIVFKEYYKNPGATEESFTDEWFHTGDIGYMDRKGFLYICGRKKNLIVFNNGKKVVPEELEAYIQELPLVKEVMVYGASTGNALDEVKLSALVCVDAEKTSETDNYRILESIQESIAELNAKLPVYKRIQSVKLSESEFKKTSMQKIQRRKVTV